jgi:hypothetical protein
LAILVPSTFISSAAVLSIPLIPIFLSFFSFLITFITSSSVISLSVSCFQRQQQSKFEKYNELTAEAKKRKAETGLLDESENKRTKQQENIKSTIMNASVVSQSAVDKLNVNFIVQGILPLQLVEQPAFLQLVHGLHPTKTVTSRIILTRRTEVSAKNTKQKLIDI